MLADVQAGLDGRNMVIDDVGIAGIRYPVAVADREHGKQVTIAEISMSVGLGASVRGAHLSRFVEVLHEMAGEITLDTIPVVLEALQLRLGAENARIKVTFPYFLRRAAPVTGAAALMNYDCWLEGEAGNSGCQVTLAVRVPVTSVCPCSKAISDYGAHNQRAAITVQVHPCDEQGQRSVVWAEELIEIAEASASAPVFPLLKRPDERHVTMRAYDRPMFVEDMVRNVAEILSTDPRITWFSVEAANEESIHNHAAFARIRSSVDHTREVSRA